MVIKILASGIVLSVITLFLLGFDSAVTSGPFFMIISNNPAVVAIRALITLAAVMVAFKGRFIYDLGRHLAGWFGAFLAVLGASGMFSHELAFSTDGFLMAYDYMLMLVLGIVFLLAAFTYQPGDKKFTLYKLQTRLKKSLQVKFDWTQARVKKAKSVF